MLVLVIFAACLLVVQIGVEFFQYKLHGFFKFCLALVVTVVIWQGMHTAIVGYANRTITHEYVLTELAKQGYYFNPDAEEILAPPFSDYDPADGGSVLKACGDHCIKNYCEKGLRQKVYHYVGAKKDIIVEKITGNCDKKNITYEMNSAKNEMINIYKYEFGYYPNQSKNQIYIGYLLNKFGIRPRIRGYYYKSNVVNYDLFLDFRQSTWMKFINFHHDSGQVFVRKSGWPEFVNVGNTNEL